MNIIVCLIINKKPMLILKIKLSVKLLQILRIFILDFLTQEKKVTKSWFSVFWGGGVQLGERPLW